MSSMWMRLGALAQRGRGQLHRRVDPRRLDLDGDKAVTSTKKTVGTIHWMPSPADSWISSIAMPDAGPASTHSQLAPGS